MKEWLDTDTMYIWMVDKFEWQDMNSAEGLEDDYLGWKLPSIKEWQTLINSDGIIKDSVPFKDTKDKYWTSSVYIHNPEQKSLIAEFTFGKLDIAVESRINPLSVKLIKR